MSTVMCFSCFCLQSLQVFCQVVASQVPDCRGIGTHVSVVSVITIIIRLRYRSILRPSSKDKVAGGRGGGGGVVNCTFTKIYLFAAEYCKSSAIECKEIVQLPEPWVPQSSTRKHPLCFLQFFDAINLVAFPVRYLEFMLTTHVPKIFGFFCR